MIDESFSQAIVRLETEYKEEADIPAIFPKDGKQSNSNFSKIFNNKIEVKSITPFSNKIPIKNSNNSFIVNNKGVRADNFLPKKYKEKRRIPRILTPLMGYNEPNYLKQEKAITEIDSLLKDNKVILIQGMPKIGKTLLASHYLDINKDKFEYCGYISIKNNLKVDFVEAFPDSFDMSIYLFSNRSNIDNIFSKLITKLNNLKGEKLLIIDLENHIKFEDKDIDKILSLKSSNYKIILVSKYQYKYIKTYPLKSFSLVDGKRVFIQNLKNDFREEALTQLLLFIDSHPYFIAIFLDMIENEGVKIEDILSELKKGNFCEIKFIDENGNIIRINDILEKIFVLDTLEKNYQELIYNLALLQRSKKMNNFQKVKDLKKYIKDDLLYGKLNFLVKQGWMIQENDSYKLPYIIQEFVLKRNSLDMKESL